MIPKELIHNGVHKTVARWEADWSLALDRFPHTLWIKWEGAEKYERFTSDHTGGFLDLSPAHE